MSYPVEDEALQFVETLAARLACLGICAPFASMAWIWRKSKI
jgi:hypothetical protein